MDQEYFGQSLGSELIFYLNPDLTKGIDISAGYSAIKFLGGKL